jgi:hypothetical protein
VFRTPAPLASDSDTIYRGKGNDVIDARVFDQP